MRLFSRRVHELSGAYALDALDNAERERFERHLRRCPACAEDVRRMTATATALAMAVAAEPPPGLKQRVLAAAAATPQLPPAAVGRGQAPSAGGTSPARPGSPGWPSGSPRSAWRRRWCSRS